MENKCCRPWVAQLLSECCSLLSCAAEGWGCIPTTWPLPGPQGTACRGSEAITNLNRDVFTIWGKARRSSIPGIRTVSTLRISSIHWCLWGPKISCTSVMLKSLHVWGSISQLEPHHVVHVPTCPSAGEAAALGSSCRTWGAFLPWASCRSSNSRCGPCRQHLKAASCLCTDPSDHSLLSISLPSCSGR